MKKKIQILILAAGKGKRMGGGELPKVLHEIAGKPIIRWLIDAIKVSGIDYEPAIVIGHGAEYIKKVLGNEYIYIYQKELLGTGHAVMQTRDILQDNCENLMVLYGDHPLISAATINNLANMHLASESVITLATTKVQDFLDWRAPLNDFGRVIRDSQGKILRIVEKKDARPEELEIKELNPGIYCFRSNWLWSNLEKLKNNNNQGEYYLTDLVGTAIEAAAVVGTAPIDQKECLGVNSKEQLDLVEKMLVH